MVGHSGASGEDAGAAPGLFLTTTPSAIALGVAAIGDVFLPGSARARPSAAYSDSLSVALSCNLALLVATFALVLAIGANPGGRLSVSAGRCSIPWRQAERP